MLDDIVILDGARTAIGTFGGALANTPPIELARIASTAALAKSGVEGGQIGHVVFGHVINTEPRDMYLSRAAAMEAGVPDSVPAMNVNRLCGSGAQAIVSAVQSLMLKDADFALAGGAENMSRSPYVVPAQRWGAKMGDVKTLDMMLGALNCPFGTGHMGVTAENVAAEHGISRAAQDAFALQSQERAAAAIAAGHFESQITPVQVKVKRDMVDFAVDEHPKATSLDALGALRTVFQKDGTVTAGNASGINDGAAALVLARASAAEAAGLKAKARVLGYAHAGVRPEVMGIGPVPAVEALSEWRCDCTGPSGWCNRCDHHAQGALRAGADGRQTRPGYDVYRWRSGDCAGSGAALTPSMCCGASASAVSSACGCRSCGRLSAQAFSRCAAAFASGRRGAEEAPKLAGLTAFATVPAAGIRMTPSCSRLA